MEELNLHDCERDKEIETPSEMILNLSEITPQSERLGQSTDSGHLDTWLLKTIQTHSNLNQKNRFNMTN